MMQDDHDEVDDCTLERYLPLIWWWERCEGRSLDSIPGGTGSTVLKMFPDLEAFAPVLDSERLDYSYMEARGHDALVNLAVDLREQVLRALVNRALDGDLGAVSWLEERGLLPDMPRVESDEPDSGGC